MSLSTELNTRQFRNQPERAPLSSCRIYLSNALHVFKWESLGFAGMIDDPKKAKADLRKVSDVDIPEGAEVFCVPVADEWGR
jgi:hypothetical protein